MNSNADEQEAIQTGSIAFATAFRFWLKLGFISFGGPAGQIAIMHAELVERRRWISERRFLHALNYCMLLPGPEAQQLATYIGWLLHGTWGGIVAGALFVLPSVGILMALSWLYVAFGDRPEVAGIFYGVKPAVVAIIVLAVVRIGRRAARTPLSIAISAAAFAAMQFLHVPFPLIILAAGVLGYLGGRLWPSQFASASGHAATSTTSPPCAAIIDDHTPPPAHARFTRGKLILQVCVGLSLWFVPIALITAWQGWQGTLAEMARFFTQAALVTFGGAYAVLPYVADHALAASWLQPGQMIDGLALGETTPGPLIMVVAFVGFVGGYAQAGMGWTGAVLGCLVATYFTFLPSFLFILIGAPLVERMRGELRLTAILSGITAAVVGVILNLAVMFAQNVFLSADLASAHVFARIDWLSVAIFVAALVAIARYRRDIVTVVIAAGLLGLALQLARIAD